MASNNQDTISQFVNSGTRQLFDITFTQASLIIATLSFFVVFIINNQFFEIINVVLEFFGIQYAKQLLYYLTIIVIGFLLTFISRDNDILTASLVIPLMYFLLDFFLLQENFTDFSLLA